MGKMEGEEGDGGGGGGGTVARRRWEEMNNDMLVKIFGSLTVFELTSGIAHVCSSWRLACCDPLLWKTLDLSMMKSNFIKVPKEPYVYVHSDSDKTLTRILKISLNLSGGNITSLFFHFNLYISEDQLRYTAPRCQDLRRLVLPAWNRVVTVICKAIKFWKELESLTMPSIENPLVLIQKIAKRCKKFRELKVMGPFGKDFASSLVSGLPTLKVLSLRCSKLDKDALICILDGLRDLEVLNISHCLLTAKGRIARELDETILQRASRLRKFLTCMKDSCIMCQRTRNDEGVLRWYRYEEGLWKEDEVSSLAL